MDYYVLYLIEDDNTPEQLKAAGPFTTVEAAIEHVEEVLIPTHETLAAAIVEDTAVGKQAMVAAHLNERREMIRSAGGAIDLAFPPLTKETKH